MQTAEINDAIKHAENLKKSVCPLPLVIPVPQAQITKPAKPCKKNNETEPNAPDSKHQSNSPSVKESQLKPNSVLLTEALFAVVTVIMLHPEKSCTVQQIYSQIKNWDHKFHDVYGTVQDFVLQNTNVFELKNGQVTLSSIAASVAENAVKKTENAVKKTETDSKESNPRKIRKEQAKLWGYSEPLATIIDVLVTVRVCVLQVFA